MFIPVQAEGPDAVVAIRDNVDKHRGRHRGCGAERSNRGVKGVKEDEGGERMIHNVIYVTH